MIWTNCPSCNWGYEKHGDTHMSTRFNCARSRNTGPDAVNDDPVLPYTGVIVTVAEADAWHAEIKLIMADRELNFGEAVDVYIAGRVNAAVDRSGWDAA